MGQRKSKLRNSYDVAPIVKNEEIKFVTSNTPANVKTIAPNVVEPLANLNNNEIANADLSVVPAWINEEHFIDILVENVPDFEKIIKFNAYPAMSAGENYATLMIRVSIDVKLKDESQKNISFMLKVAHDNEQMRQMLGVLNFFIPETAMYFDVFPQLELMYTAVGVDVCFAPKAYKFKKDPGCQTILLEDLRPYGFKNANRLECLNMEHTKSVLRKLAEFHAASACFVETKGPFPDVLMNGLYGENSKALMDSMTSSFRIAFFNNMKNYKGCEKYQKSLELSFKNIFDELFGQMLKYDPNEFNVLNHGDCWSNNILFRYDDDGNLKDTYFVDFQTSKWGTPAQDLYYFIISSVNIDIKLKNFDELIRYYYDSLVDCLQTLKYHKKVITLRELYTQLHKYGAWALTTAMMTLPVVLLDPTETARFENFMGNTDEGIKFKNLMFTNKRYVSYIEEILPWLHNRGLLDTLKSNQGNEEISDTIVPKKKEQLDLVPDWVNAEYFEDILRKNIQDFKSIKDLTVVPATASGDNYSSIMLKVDMNVELNAGDTKFISYMLKIAPSGEEGNAMLSLAQTFKKECIMYNEIIPKLENLYKNSGCDLIFAPRSFEFVKDPGCETVLMENLRTSGFKNADRLTGLDMEHTKSALSKLAQFHAASAHNFVLNGPYDVILTKGLHSEDNRVIMEKIGEHFLGFLKESMETYKGSDAYINKIETMKSKMFEIMLDLNKINPDKFNVLNHGDCWTNNIMFQYDSEGKIINTYFVDFQLVKYGTAAQDLYYFLLSSPCLENKIKHFDYFIRFYHENLKRNLELLNYPKMIPTLKELHRELLQCGGWAVSTVSGVMTAVLLDPTDDANIDMILGDNEKSNDFKRKMFSAPRYRAHAEALFAWMNSRGLLDFDFTEDQAHDSNVPSWVDKDHFVDIVVESEPSFSKIVNLTAASATKGGDNYASIMLRVEADIELKDATRKQITYMLKIAPTSSEAAATLSLWNFFAKESAMYLEYLPAFEKMYKEAGAELVFAPKAYTFKNNPGCETVVMEDLKSRGFKNGNRLEGLDMAHTLCALKKMAQLHAASVRWVEQNGVFPDIFMDGIYSVKSQPVLNKMSHHMNAQFVKSVSEYEDNKDYVDKMSGLVEVHIDKLTALNTVDPTEFNVLNHGDSWLNNIMFQYDDEGTIENTYFVDFQVLKYGSPANDLYYFLLSSTNLDIKVEQFDYFIKFYHEQLVENVQLLKCTTKPPTLKELHCTLLKYGSLGFNALLGVMPVCLLDPTESAHMDNFSVDTPEARAFRKQLYSNARYTAHARTVLKWLNSRGLLDL